LRSFPCHLADQLRFQVLSVIDSRHLQTSTVQGKCLRNCHHWMSTLCPSFQLQHIRRQPVSHLPPGYHRIEALLVPSCPPRLQLGRGALIHGLRRPRKPRSQSIHFAVISRDQKYLYYCSTSAPEMSLWRGTYSRGL